MLSILALIAQPQNVVGFSLPTFRPLATPRSRVLSCRPPALPISRVPRCAVCMMAKKKTKGSFSIEELEAQEALLFGDLPPPPPPPPTKGSKAPPEVNQNGANGANGAGGGVKNANKAAAAALESLFNDDDMEMSGKKKKDKKDKKNKGGGAAMDMVAMAQAMANGDEVDFGHSVAEETSKVEKGASEAIAGEQEMDEDAISDPNKETLEEKIRKTRPPPRVRITESAQPGYVSMRLEDVAVTFRNQEVLKEATWDVKTGERVGLVGPNGGGKTTQMKILAGELEPTAGEVVLSSKALRVAFLRQEFIDELVLERSLKEEMTSVFTEELGILEGLKKVEDDLADPAVQASPDAMEEAINRLTQLQEDADRKKIYELDTRVEKVMDLMGFLPSDGAQPVSAFSGGWRMRIGLGKILLQDPNVLLLDEPTNHLDLESVEWLENFLQNQNLPMVIVSHDREFLDRVCTKIVDTDCGIATTYEGNYSRFIKLKKARLEAMENAYGAQQKKIQEERAWINKYKNKGSFASQIKSREKSIEKMTSGSDAVPKPPRPGKPFVFRFPPAPRINEEVLSVEGLTHKYDGPILFNNCNIRADKGDRIAFLGPNGAGKSTLLRLIMGLEKPSEGGVAKFGPSVLANYFQQNQADALDMDKTVLQVVEDASNGHAYAELRKLLGQFLFKGDNVEKKIHQLSGGEKARCALCTFMLRPANLLILDEPTNHLDIPAKEMLEEALQHFDGAVLLVSHDRYFVSQVANTIITIENGETQRYEGDYRYYMMQNEKLLDKVESRYVDGVKGIVSAKVVDLVELQAKTEKRNFGGKGGPSGDKTKGIKNAKRMNI